MYQRLRLTGIIKWLVSNSKTILALTCNLSVYYVHIFNLYLNPVTNLYVLKYLPCTFEMWMYRIVSYRMAWMSGQYLNRLPHQLYAREEGEGRNAKPANELVISQQSASWCCELQRAQLNRLRPGGHPLHPALYPVVSIMSCCWAQITQNQRPRLTTLWTSTLLESYSRASQDKTFPPNHLSPVAMGEWRRSRCELTESFCHRTFTHAAVGCSLQD